jgi:glycosyltransferase involved in cell wall biosynthesis
MTPQITVIIPAYNRVPSLIQAVSSVFCQTYAPVEVIVVDDGSPDYNLADELKSFKEHHGDCFRVIRQKNKGLPGARNTGIEAARTEWVAFLDDDDEWSKDRLWWAVQNIRSHPEANVHLTNTQIIPDCARAVDLFKERGFLYHPNMPIVERNPLLWALSGAFFAQSLVVRRQALLDVGNFTDTMYEDLDLYVKLSGNLPWIIDGRFGLHLMRRPGTIAMSEGFRKKQLQRTEALVRVHRKALEVCPVETRAFCREKLSGYLFERGMALKQAGMAYKEVLLEAANTTKKPKSKLKCHLARLPFGHHLVKLLQPKKGLVR